MAVRMQFSFLPYPSNTVHAVGKDSSFHVHIHWPSSHIPRPCRINYLPQGTLANVRRILGTPRTVLVWVKYGSF